MSPLLNSAFMSVIKMKANETCPRLTIEEIEVVIRSLLWAQERLEAMGKERNK